ncbi:MAG: hypothetical protein COW30_12965 [Rhodospirillales bacterium CG15_BIG_FIL_POST_REV_8_21_14_020_66_15]|nr:MAG: hypothetical protein COW30_12965 [Rhodospirillales bacterium CG15_BIG_FIL_POST_REV_8_21_14_020_66_15]
MRRRSRDFNIFSLSALDLFASAMGAFVIISVMLFPFYRMNAPNLAQAAQVRKEVEDLKRQTEAMRKQAGIDRAAAAAAGGEAAEADKQRAAVETELQGQQAQIRKGGEALQQCKIALSKLDIHEYDLALVFDTSGSMSAVIKNILLNLRGVVRVMQKMVPNLRIGLVAFHDGRAEAFPLTQMDEAGVRAALQWLQAHGTGSGTNSTDVFKGLSAAAAMTWRRDVPKAIVVIADDPDDDAPSHQAHGVARRFAGRPKAKVAVVTPDHAGQPRFFKDLAKAGGGDFVSDKGDLLTSILLTVIER